MSNTSIPTPAEDPALWANSDGEIMGASMALLVLPTVFVALRLVSRYMAGAGFWWDDYTIVLGMVLSWGGNITNILASRDSLGHHIMVLSMETRMSFFRHLYAFLLQYWLAMTSVKFSIILFQYRIFPIPSFRRILVAAGVFVLAFGTASTIVFAMPCIPVSNFWLSLSKGLKGNERRQCVSIGKHLMVNGTINTVTDFVLLLLPLRILWRLKASRLQKFVLTGIFITGLVVTAISMVRLVVLARYNGHDMTYDFVPTSIWTAAEPSIAVLCACLPSLRPLFVRIFPLFHISLPRTTPTQHDDFSSSNNLASTFRSRSNTTNNVYDNRSFNRLHDDGGVGVGQGRSRRSSLGNGVAIYGGKGGGGGGKGRGKGEVQEEVMEMGGEEDGEDETPVNRIRAKTTVVWTVSERVDWRDDLF